MGCRVFPFPDLLYVKAEDDNGNEYYVAMSDVTSLTDPMEKVRVATYKLVEVNDFTLIPQKTPAKNR